MHCIKKLQRASLTADNPHPAAAMLPEAPPTGSASVSALERGWFGFSVCGGRSRVARSLSVGKWAGAFGSKFGHEPSCGRMRGKAAVNRNVSVPRGLELQELSSNKNNSNKLFQPRGCGCPPSASVAMADTS